MIFLNFCLIWSWLWYLRETLEEAASIFRQYLIIEVCRSGPQCISYYRWWCWSQDRWPWLPFPWNTTLHLFSWRSHRSCLEWFYEQAAWTNKESSVLRPILRQLYPLSWKELCICFMLFWPNACIRIFCLWKHALCPHRMSFISCKRCLTSFTSTQYVLSCKFFENKPSLQSLLLSLAKGLSLRI